MKEKIMGLKTLWRKIKNRSINFSEYEKFIDEFTRKEGKGIPFRDRSVYRKRPPFVKSEDYNLVKFATEYYLRRKPHMTELIWSYWMEQGMLVQTFEIINLRFQNIEESNDNGRLHCFNIESLRPISHLLWGYIKDEKHRSTLKRRLNEYDHQYGLTLTGKALPSVSQVGSRVQFLEAFHNLLNLCVIYFRESDDAIRIADALPVLNSLKEVHLLLVKNNNAPGNFEWTSRQEMLMQQYILSRPEIREFLGGRVGVSYPESWMDNVDTMRTIQGWGDEGIVHYYELAVHGELILLSIRHTNWSDVTLDKSNAANWAQEFRKSIQRYIHAYRAVTGVDLSGSRVQSVDNFVVAPKLAGDDPIKP